MKGKRKEKPNLSGDANHCIDHELLENHLGVSNVHANTVVVLNGRYTADDLRLKGGNGGTSSMMSRIPLFRRQSAGRGSFSFPVENPWIYSQLNQREIRSAKRWGEEEASACPGIACTAARSGN